MNHRFINVGKLPRGLKHDALYPHVNYLFTKNGFITISVSRSSKGMSPKALGKIMDVGILNVYVGSLSLC